MIIAAFKQDGRLCVFWRQLFREADEGEGFKCEEGEESEKKKCQWKIRRLQRSRGRFGRDSGSMNEDEEGSKDKKKASSQQAL